jgi:hypothetical protein
MGQHLSSKDKALSSNSSTTKKQKQKLVKMVEVFCYFYFS